MTGLDVQMGSGAESARAERRATVSMRIELATLKLCLERGIEGVTVEEVAAASGISRRTFYRYFETIDDVLCAMPRRSLKRISNDFSSRPLCENPFEAFIQVAKHTRVTNEERAIHRLAVDVAQRSSNAWWRAMNRMQPSANDVFMGIIAKRLRAAGKDPASAGLIAAVLQAVIGHVVQESVKEGKHMPDPHRLEEALNSLVGIVRGALNS